MARIEVKMSQLMLENGMRSDWVVTGGLLDSLVEAAATIGAGFPEDALKFAQTTIENGVVRIVFPGDIVLELTGVQLDNPRALSGAAVATGIKITAPDQASTVDTGLFSFSYALGAHGLEVQVSSAIIHSASLKTLVPATSPEYNQWFGNTSTELAGALTVDSTGKVGGNVTSVSLGTDKILQSGSIKGDLSVSGKVDVNGVDSHVSVHGMVSSMEALFHDGSYARVTDLTLPFNSAGKDDLFTLIGSGLSGNDTIRIEMPDTMADVFVLAAGAGNDAVQVGGGGGKLAVEGGAGNDIITILSGVHKIDGGGGADTVVYSGARAEYTVAHSAAGLEVSGNAGTDVLTRVERLQFADTTVAFDIDGNGGQAYRVYQAAFDRKPDTIGLGFWIKALDNQVSLEDVAASFLQSREFFDLYRASSQSMSAETFVTTLYANVLHRAYDKGGFDFWVDALSQKGVSKAAVLAAFSESVENQAQVIGTIDGGFSYAPFVG